jgi:hypothetical protein
LKVLPVWANVAPALRSTRSAANHQGIWGADCINASFAEFREPGA